MGLMSLEDSTKGQLIKHNNTHFMMVDGISKLMSKQVKICQSSEFIVWGVKWRFVIRSDQANDYLSYFLEIADENCIGPAWEVTCTLQVSMVSQTGHDYIFQPVEIFYKEKEKSKGVINFISYKVLKEKYIVNDKAVFGAKFSNVKQNFSVESIILTVVRAERVKLMEVPRNKSRFTWKITRFSTFNDTFHSSYEFTVGPRRWKLIMYPKGDAIGKGGHMSLFLSASDSVTNNVPNGSTLAVYKLRVLDQLKRNHHETSNCENWFKYEPDPECTWGISKFLPLEELNKPSRGLLVNDEIYLGVEFLFYSISENL